ncbi:unnamed protein product [Schistosoma turkestanicum]|nr:unnamed protein product [Schistosoma turkestanicum]
MKLEAYRHRNYQHFYPSTSFLYADGCLNKVATEQQNLMYSFITICGIISICLQIIRLTIFCVTCNQIQTKCSNESAEIKQYSTYSSSFKNMRYISNSRLLSACQSYWLFEQPALMHLQFENLKSHWLEKIMGIGWIFFNKGKHYVTFLRRINFQEKSPKLSTFRQLLRYSIPTFEMITYADGNDMEETEANVIYGGYISRLMRMICFLLFGILIGEFFLYALIPVRSEAVEVLSGDERLPDNIIQRDAEALASDIEWMTRIFIRITITVATVVSCRFRCLLLLIIPGVAQTVGVSYLGNELAHVSITGPVQNLERNLRSASESIICFIKLAHNMTRDTNDFLEKAKEAIRLEEGLNYLETVKAKSAKLKEKINRLNQSIQKINQEINKTKAMVENARSVLFSGDGGSNIYANMSMEMARRAKEAMKKRAKASKDSIVKMMKPKDLNFSLSKRISDLIDDGLGIEYDIETRMQMICMIFYKTRAVICNQSAVRACTRMQNLIFSAALPIIIKNLCLRKISSGVACPTDHALQQAVSQCSSSLSKIGFSTGFGPLFLQAQQDLYQIKQTFHFTIKHKLLEFQEITNWLKRRSTLIEYITRQTKQTILVIMKLSLIFNSLFKSICLLVFYQAHRWISSYLLDPDYDNIYIELPFEQIDHKRSKESRETLLPLKKHELKNVIWHQKMYKKNELIRAIKSLIKVIGLGFSFSLFFVIDFYMTEVVLVLDEVASTTFKVGSEKSDEKSKKHKLQIKGDGIFTELLQKAINILRNAGEINLIYDLRVCSPKAEYTKFKYYSRFCAIWLLMMILSLISGYMLRLRHKILSFFYPRRSKHRFIHLYNKLLVNRRCQMTTARNVLVHQSSQNRLQREAEKLSHSSLLYNCSLFKRNKVNCIICMEKYKIGKNSLIYVCPYDGTAICQYCLTTLFNNHKICITCLDRNYKRLEQINKNISNLKKIIINE